MTIKRMLPGLLVGGVMGCGQTVTMVVSPFPAVCSGEGQWICPTVEIDGGAPEPLGCGIAGLTEGWGTTYAITAALVDHHTPMADGCGDVYDLVSIEDSSFAGEESFTLSWVHDMFIEVDGSSGTVGYLDFVCEDEAVCEDMAAAIGAAHDLTFRTPAVQGDPVVLTAVTASE